MAQKSICFCKRVDNVPCDEEVESTGFGVSLVDVSSGDSKIKGLTSLDTSVTITDNITTVDLSVNAAVTSNIYNNDGTINSTRIVDFGINDMYFEMGPTSNFQVSRDSSFPPTTLNQASLLIDQDNFSGSGFPGSSIGYLPDVTPGVEDVCFIQASRVLGYKSCFIGSINTPLGKFSSIDVNDLNVTINAADDIVANASNQIVINSGGDLTLSIGGGSDLLINGLNNVTNTNVLYYDSGTQAVSYGVTPLDFYTSDGILSSNRLVDGVGFNIRFANMDYFKIDTDEFYLDGLNQATELNQLYYNTLTKAVTWDAVAVAPATNIYNSDGTLTANRVADCDNFTLTFDDFSTFNISSSRIGSDVGISCADRISLVSTNLAPLINPIRLVTSSFSLNGIELNSPSGSYYIMNLPTSITNTSIMTINDITGKVARSAITQGIYTNNLYWDTANNRFLYAPRTAFNIEYPVQIIGSPVAITLNNLGIPQLYNFIEIVPMNLVTGQFGIALENNYNVSFSAEYQNNNSLPATKDDIYLTLYSVTLGAVYYERHFVVDQNDTSVYEFNVNLKLLAGDYQFRFTNTLADVNASLSAVLSLSRNI